jgi:hypothetical protein
VEAKNKVGIKGGRGNITTFCYLSQCPFLFMSCLSAKKREVINYYG